jgi:AcrR family transcriptional regulator
MASSNSSPAIRKPQRQRGVARVESLLEAAGEAFAEKGYDAATMTEIAARAGASIGSLYQFFPTKELVAEALVARYVSALHADLRRMAGLARSMDARSLGAKLLRTVYEFRRKNPGFVTLGEATNLPDSIVLGLRNTLRELITDILVAFAPEIAREKLRPQSFVLLQLMKSFAALSAEPGIKGRKDVLAALEDTFVLALGHLDAARN